MARQVARYKDQLKTDKRRHFMRRVLFVVGILIATLVVAIYLLFFAKLLDVRSINISTDAQASEIKDSVKGDIDQWLDGKKFLLQRRHSEFLIETDKLQEQLKSKYSKIDTIKITRHLPHQINVNIVGRKPFGIWCTDQCFYFNEKGIAYELAPQTSGFLILKVIDERNHGVSLGDKVIEDNWIVAIDSSYKKLAQKNFKVNSFTIPKDSLNDFYALTSTNLEILLDIETDIPSQIDSMTAFLAAKLTKERVSQLQYIDLRIQDHIYYK